MKGIIFNIYEEFIVQEHGENVFDDIIEICNLETKEPFVAPGTYPYDDFFAILEKSTKILEVNQNDILIKFGYFAFGMLAERYPTFVTPFNHPKPFLKTVESVIHVEVRKLYSQTELPTFQYNEPSNNELIITYFSKRKLYPLMEGLINGVADHFNVPTEQAHNIYEKDGNEFCDFHLKFA